MAYELGIVGAGNMAEAIARSLISTQRIASRQMIAADVSPQRRELFEKGMGIRAVADNADAVRDARIVLLSVKPQHMKEVLAGLGTVMHDTTLVISIAAGISSAFIEKHLGGNKFWRVVRTMPNTPVLVGQGMVAIAPGRHARPEDLAAARDIFSAGATVMQLEEDKIDAVTAMSGSGPAYFFYLVEQMVKAGESLGLSAEQSHILATQTALGAAKMLTTSADTPEQLRRKVTSPGGTTQAAIETMEQHGVGPAIISAIKQAAARSKELGAS
jgi:pyrroline-5-carboxylate reductase